VYFQCHGVVILNSMKLFSLLITQKYQINRQVMYNLHTWIIHILFLTCPPPPNKLLTCICCIMLSSPPPSSLHLCSVRIVDPPHSDNIHPQSSQTDFRPALRLDSLTTANQIRDQISLKADGELQDLVPWRHYAHTEYDTLTGTSLD